MSIRSILKWPGGKAKLLEKISVIFDVIETKNATFYDLFGGGGTVSILAKKHFKNVVYNDINKDLVNLFLTVRDDLYNLKVLLDIHKRNHDSEYYYKIRDLDRNSDYYKLSNVERAARFLYLNKTCYNGLYRVNSKGEFNVPIGSYKNISIYQEDNIFNFSKIIKDMTFYNKDYKELINLIKPGDVVYLDPPYDKINADSFVEYTHDKFGETQQEYLAKVFKKLTKRGVYIILSNSLTPKTVELFKDYLEENSLVTVNRSIGSKKESRKKIQEILINNIEAIKSEN
jgi:DNA adenine methylase